jgi:hypothetical protein
MAAFRRSGVSLRALAERARVPYSTLVHWRRRGEPTDPPRIGPVETAPAGGLIEVVVGSVVARVEPGFDEAHVGRVVRSLRAY